MTNSPSAPTASFTLNVHQKRQAALLYHWMSLDYLKGLKERIDALINGADVTLDFAQRQQRDALIANERWGVRDTSANWSTHVYPALEDFRKATIRDIALRAVESYEFTGANQCSRMISEFSSMWMTPEEEERFKAQFEAVDHYAQFIDFAAGVGGLRHQLDDQSMVLYWLEHKPQLRRLPQFKVRADIEGVTDKRPPRTGVYVPQDDPFGTLQFAWTGNNDGILGKVETLSDAGLRAMAAIGRGSMWRDGDKMVAYAVEAFRRKELTERGGFRVGAEADSRSVGAVLSQSCFTSRPSKWYFVEMIEGEYEVDTDAVGTAPEQLRCPAGSPCPREGMWHTPARAGSRRHFDRGDVMPDLGSDYGATIWEWDSRDQ